MRRALFTMLTCALVAAPTVGAHTGGKLRPLKWARSVANSDIQITAQNKNGETVRFVSAGNGAQCAGIGKAKVVRRVRLWRHFGCTTQLLDGYGDNLQGVIEAYFQIHSLAPGTGSVYVVSNINIQSCIGIDCPVHR